VRLRLLMPPTQPLTRRANLPTQPFAQGPAMVVNVPEDENDEEDDHEDEEEDEEEDDGTKPSSSQLTLLEAESSGVAPIIAPPLLVHALHARASHRATADTEALITSVRLFDSVMLAARVANLHSGGDVCVSTISANCGSSFSNGKASEHRSHLGDVEQGWATNKCVAEHQREGFFGHTVPVTFVFKLTGPDQMNRSSYGVDKKLYFKEIMDTGERIVRMFFQDYDDVSGESQVLFLNNNECSNQKHAAEDVDETRGHFAPEVWHQKSTGHWNFGYDTRNRVDAASSAAKEFVEVHQERGHCWIGDDPLIVHNPESKALSNTHTGWWYLNNTFGPVGILHGNLQAIAQATRNKPKNLMNYVINRGRNGGKEDSKSLRTTMGCWTVFFEPCEVGWGWVRARVPARCARTAHG